MSWIDEEYKAVELENQQSINQRGLIPYWKAPEGTSVIEVNVDKAPQDSGRFPARKEIYIKCNGTDYIWSINKKSPIYREIIVALKNGAKKFEVIRVGSDSKDTRYKLKPIQ